MMEQGMLVIMIWTMMVNDRGFNDILKIQTPIAKIQPTPELELRLADGGLRTEQTS